MNSPSNYVCIEILNLLLLQFLDDSIIRDIEKFEDENAEEWVKNINWLRKYNAKDFTEFNQHNYDVGRLNMAIDKLVADLRKPVEKEKA